MTVHEWLSFATCAGLLTLAIVVMLRGNRNSMELPLLLLCIDDFGWNFGAMSHEMTGEPAWHWLDVTISPLAVPLALHVAVAFVGRVQSLRTILVLGYAAFGLLSGVSALAFAVVALRPWTFSREWSVLCLAGYVPCVTLALALLVIHLRAAREPVERRATALTIAALVLGATLTATELFDDVGLDLPALGNVGTLVSTALLAVAISHLGMLQRRISWGLLTYAGALSAAAVGAYVMLLRRFHSDAVVVSLGLITLALAVSAGTRDLMGAVRHAKEQEERLASLGRMADQMAHDIRNPLAALKGALQFVREEQRRAEDTRFAEFHDLMLDQVERLDRVVSGYRSMSDVEPVRSLVQVNDVVAELSRLHNIGAGSIEVRSVLAPNLPTCRADRDLLIRAIENLIKNATDAMKERGTLTLRTEHRPTWFGPPWIAISVEDTGPGMDARQLNRVFREAHTTKPDGTGLGLGFVHRVVQAHGGRVALTSKPGQGTTVRLKLRAS